MAYTDQTSDPRRRAAAIGGVVAIHTVLALGLLSITIAGHKEVELPWRSVVITPDPRPTPPPQPEPATERDPTLTIPDIPVSPPLPPVDFGSPAPAAPVGDGLLFDLADGVGTPVPLPNPVPSQAPPAFVPRAPSPIGTPARWITTDDYPARALRDGVEGIAGYRVIVGSNGRVASCEITSSTGNEALDQATCRHITRRARFEAATDERGQTVLGSYAGRVRWDIPEER